MNIFRRFTCYCIVNYIVLWVSGCSSKFSNIEISNLNSSIGSRLSSTSKFIQKKDVIYNPNASFNFLNKYNLTNNSRYTYSHVSKGSYSGYSYIVQPGDTLFYIAWLTGDNCYDLAKKNSIDTNDILKIGQILQVGSKYNNGDKKCLKKNLRKTVNKDENMVVSVLNTSKLDNIISNKSCVNNINKLHMSNKRSVYSSIMSKNNTQKLNNIPHGLSVSSNTKEIVKNISSDVKQQSSISWGWPAIGKIVSNFSSSEGGNKGLDISGVSGQPVFAASCGKVVYAGNDLFGYGNLIIIKHDHNFLSTYAHNEKILVVEQQNVALGQKIATMGNSGSDSTKLHFEIRYKGRSVNPLYYLPKNSY